MTGFLLIAAAFPCGATAGDAWIAAHIDELDALYKHLHTHPELSYQEHETAKRMAVELEKAGARVVTGVGKLGVVGVLKNGPGPVVLVRTDMDALPVTEETGLPYASRQTATDKTGRTVGVMHACGHDVHMTCFIGTARWLADHRDRWSGTVLMVAQPAEEAIGGARAMLDDGLYTRFPRPDFALALHCTADQPTGTVHYCPGPLLASSTSVTVTIRGKGGHGAWPHRTVDPIVLAALVVVDLQTIVSREIEPTEPAVVTVGSIHGGTKHNIIPNEVKLQLTLRTFSEPVRQQLLAGIRRRVEGLSRAHQAPDPTVEEEESTPPTINTPALVERSCPPSSRPSAPNMSRRPRPSWAPRISGSSAKATSRSACSGSGPSTPRGWKRHGPGSRTYPRSIRRSIIPIRSQASRPASAQ